MQGRSLLGKRSSFSNFSTFKTSSPPDQTYERQHGSIDSNGNSGDNSRHGSVGEQGYDYPENTNNNSNNNGNNISNTPPSNNVNYSAMNSSATYMNHQQYLPRRSAYYESHWPLYTADWTQPEWSPVELIAVGTFSEDASNKLQILHANKVNDPITSIQTMEFQQCSESLVSYPATKIEWEPRPGTNGNSNGSVIRMISTGDCLRLWDYDIESCKLQQRCALLNKSKSEFMPPLTSFDWNKTDPSLVITSSIDTTCTIWDINTSSARTQLIAHDNEVYDVTFIAGSTDIFTSVGADGSVRVFDLRSLDHSTIIYEPSKPIPLLRIASNPCDRNMLATIAADSNKIFILDIRAPGVPLAALEGHQKSINSIAWSPPYPASNKMGSSRNILASSSDDCQVLLWDMSSTNSSISNPLISAYTDSAEVNNVTWNASGEWLGAVSGRGIQGVRVC